MNWPFPKKKVDPHPGLTELKNSLQQGADYAGNPMALTGGGIGAVIGTLIAQRMRQPIPGLAKSIPMTKRPEELVPGAALGGTAGIVIANMIRQAQRNRTQLEQLQ